MVIFAAMMKKMSLRNIIKTTLFFSMLAIISLSCSKDDDDEDLLVTPVNRGNIFPNKMEFILTSKSDTTQSATYTYYDPDGVGGADPITADTAIFTIAPGASQASYIGKLNLYRDNTLLNSQIIANDFRYMICYREFNFFELAVSSYGQDRNGNRLGLNSEWLAKIRDRKGSIKVTMNFNQQPKDGIACDAGSRVYEAYLPFSVE